METFGLSAERVQKIVEDYEIPNHVKIRAVRNCATSSPGFMRICKKHFWYGFRISPTRFQFEVLKHDKMEIDQLVPNSISFIDGFELYYYLVGVNLGVSEFWYFYQRKQSMVEDIIFALDLHGRSFFLV